MKRTTSVIKSKSDGLSIHFTVTEPETAPVGILQISHGMAEHKERYFHFCDFLAEKGYITVINDHRGHGQSVKSSKDLGFFYDNGAKSLIEDLHQITEYIKEQYPSLPCFLLGHSMGSLAVRAYAKKYDRDIDGLIVCGSPSYNPGMNAGRTLAISSAKIHGLHYRSEHLNSLAFGAFNKKFNDSGSNNNWICSDPKVVNEYDSDPLCGFTFTLNGFISLFDLMRTAYSPKNWAINNPSLPVWFIAGEDDPCIINRDKFISALGVMQYAGYENVTYRLYPKMRHEILNETDKQVVYDDIADRLDFWRKNYL